MKFEEVLPALREGKKVWRAAWNKHSDYCLFIDDLDNGIELRSLLEDDWEIVQEPKLVADYFVHSHHYTWYRETHEVGKQPKGSVMVPGTEREEE